MIVKNKTDKLEAAESKNFTYLERLQSKETDLHERLIEQTQDLQMARAYRTKCQTAVETTMRELEEVRYKLHRLWQQAP